MVTTPSLHVMVEIAVESPPGTPQTRQGDDMGSRRNFSLPTREISRGQRRCGQEGKDGLIDTPANALQENPPGIHLLLLAGHNYSTYHALYNARPAN